MNIGIDIDDTITNTYETLIPMIAIKYGLNLSKLLKTKPNYSMLSDVIPGYNEDKLELFTAMAKIVPLKEDVINVLTRLREDGHKIIFITARNTAEYGDPYKISYDYLKSHNVPFDGLYTNVADKASKCVIEGIDLFIDDSTMNCKAVKRRGVPTLQFDACFTKPIKDLKRVNSWEEVYQIVKELNLNIELISFQNHFNSNCGTINFWLDRVDSVLVCNELTKEELEYITLNANKDVCLQVYGHNQAMYSRRYLLSNFAKEFNLDKKLKNTLIEKVSGIKFRAIENEFGTVLYSGNIFNGLDLLKLSNVKYFYINTTFISHDDVMKVLENLDGSILDSDDGFLNKPTIYLPGGAMLPGNYKGHQLVCGTDSFHLYNKYTSGEITLEEMTKHEGCLYGSPGACPIMGTANTCQTVCEALGIALPNSASCLGVSGEKLRMSEETGRQIVELVKKDIKCLDIINEESIKNAIKVLMATGGSTNLIIHLIAIARRANINLKLMDFEEIVASTPANKQYLVDSFA